MKWKKAPEELKILLERAVSSIDCEKRPMFGYPVYFTNGYMFAGLFQDSVFLRLSEDQVADLKKKYPSIRPMEVMQGRAMKDYSFLPEDLYRDESVLKETAARSAGYTRTLPPKKKKKPKKKA